MNHAYRLVWNEATQAYIPVAEGTRARTKSGRCKALKSLSSLVTLASLAGVYAGGVQASPSGGEVVAGQATITHSSQGGNATTTVNQQSQNAVLNWQQFNVAANETVQFVQPSATSIALNRVVGSDASQIFGRLSANGQVFLINPNGVLFGHGAQVDVGGLVASTLNLSDADFLAGRYRFESSSAAPAGVINQGTITAAPGGSVALLGGQVSNQGTISAQLGTVALAAGSAVSLDFSGRQLINVQVDAATLGALADNRQLIRADGGTVIMTTSARDALLSTVVNNTGVIEARTVQNQDGVIKLLGSFDGGTVNVGGTLDASAPNGGNGGFIETSGAYVKVADGAHITTRAPEGSAGTWLIDPADYTIAASGGDITGATLSANLENGNVSILSTEGTVNVVGNGDINVNDAITWSGAHTLTLTALGSVNVNAAITNTGSPAGGGVTLRADAAAACITGATACGTVNFSGAGHIEASVANLYYNPAGGYAAPTDYAPNVTGTLNPFMLVNDLDQLQAVGTNVQGSYALGADIDASATATWDGGAGFEPIALNGPGFTGRFDGLGHSISNLVINRPDGLGVGLFGGVRGTAEIRNLHLIGGSITGDAFVGALIGDGFTTGAITVSNVSSSARVRGVGRSVGGLVGSGDRVNVSDSWANGDVEGEIDVGGLMGDNWRGVVSNSYATGSVTGTSVNIGGLVGSNFGNITDSYATGAVTSSSTFVGGLVGYNYHHIAGSYATGAVSGTQHIGGLAGYNAGPFNGIANSYATGAVNGTRNVGGLVGTSDAPITNAYATGAATGTGTGNRNIGGLVGENQAAVTNVYATGAVTGSRNVGGLVGVNSSGDSGSSGTATNGFWNIETSGVSQSAGGTGITSAQLRDADTFSAWDISAAGGSSAVWRIYEGNTGPLLRSFLTGITIAVGSASSTYNGLAQAFNVTYDAAGADRNLIFSGSATYRNAGSYNLGDSLYSGQHGYDISYTGGALDIARANLVLSSADVVKTYDGTTNANATAVAVGGTQLFDGDSLSGGVFAFADRNAGAGNRIVTIDGVSIDDGNGGANYNVSYVDNTTSTINRAELTVTGLVAADKIYDATTNATLSGGVLNGLFGSDEVSMTLGAGSFADKNAGADKLVTASVVIGGADAGNYVLAGPVRTTASIARATITDVNGITAIDKVYDGNASAALDTSGATLVGMFAGDQLSVGATGTFSDPNAGTGKSVAITGMTLAGADAGNYRLASDTDTTTASIARANLTITANNQTRWLGLVEPELTLTYSGFVAGEDASVLTTQPTVSTSANSTALVGNYEITASGAASQNYSFTYVPGRLTVLSPATLTAGYPETLAYLDDVGSDETSDAESERQQRLRDKSSPLQLRNHGIKLPAGVR